MEWIGNIIINVLGQLTSTDYFQFSLVQFSSSVMSKSLPPHEPQQARPPCPSPAARVHPNPCPSSRWCHPTISSSTVPFSSCPQSFPALRSFHHLLNTYTIIFAHSSHLCSLLVNYHEQALQVIINFIGWPSSSFEDSLSEKQEKEKSLHNLWKTAYQLCILLPNL